MHKYLYSNYNNNPINFHMFRGFHDTDYFIHTHDFAEFAIVTEGECTHIADGSEYPLKRGEVYVILPNVYHGLKDVKKPLKHYTFMFNLTNLILFDVEIKNLSGFFSMFMPSHGGEFANRLYLNEEEMKKVSELCEIMLEEYEAKRPGFQFVLRAMLASLIGIMLRSYHSSNSGDTESYEKIKPAIEYIEENYEQKITLELLAEKCFLSGRQLSRLFDKVYGKSPSDYLLNYRLTAAYLYIMTTEMSISSIARKCGFYDESHLSKMFSRRYGFLPSKIRNKSE